MQSSTPDVTIPGSAWEIMTAKLDQLIVVTARIDRRQDSLEDRRDQDAARAKALDRAAGRLSEAVMRFSIRQAAAKAIPAFAVLVAVFFGAAFGGAAAMATLTVLRPPVVVSVPTTVTADGR